MSNEPNTGWRLREIGIYSDGSRTFALLDPKGCERAYGTMEDFEQLLGAPRVGVGRAIEVEYIAKAPQ